MAKTSVDELLEALETIGILRDAVGKHEQAITKILDLMDRFERRLDALERGRP